MSRLPCVFLLLALTAHVAGTPAGFAATITDADTLIVGGVSYKIDGVDAPEPDQPCLDRTGRPWPCGAHARERLLAYLDQRTVTCEDRGKDPAHPRRRIGICRVNGEPITVNQWLVREGLAINFEPYAKGRFKADEAAARDAGRGVWAGCFAAPRDFRRGNSTKAILLGSACPADAERATRHALFPPHPDMPSGCPIKATTPARAALTGHRGIYHLPGCRSYQRTRKPNHWFCAEEDAEAAGYRKAFTC